MGERRTGPVVLGIDVGTSGVKALALSLDGDGVVATATARHGFVAGQTALEADPESWWGSVCHAVRDCVREVGPERIQRVGVSGHMSSVVLVDDTGQHLRPALLLSDGRGAEEIAALPLDLRAEVERRSHNPLITAFSLAKLLWLQAHEPAVLARSRAWLAAKDYIRMRFTGTFGSDVTDAYNSLLLDPGTLTWQDDLRGALGLPEHAFPGLDLSSETVGHVTAGAARDTGLVPGTPVVAGAADMATAALGSHAIGRGQVAISMGTSYALSVPMGHEPFPPSWASVITYHPLPDGLGSFGIAGLLTGGLALTWMRDLFGGDPVQVPDEPPPAGAVQFLPHLSGAGSPTWESAMRGSMIGLTPHTSRADLTLAMYEALCFELAEIIDVVAAEHGVADIVITGGGSRIDAQAQILADVTGALVHRLQNDDVSALGAAVLAHPDFGRAPTEHVLDTVVRRGAEFRPRPETRAGWAVRRSAYNRAFDDLRAHYVAARDDRLNPGG